MPTGAGVPVGLAVLLDWKALIVAAVMAAFMAGGGLTLPWRLGPWWAGLFVLVAQWGMIVGLAAAQGTLAFGNIAFFVGDPFLAGVVGMGSYTSARMPELAAEWHWLAGRRFRWGLVSAFYAAGLLSEYLRIWRNPKHNPVLWSDWWHHAFYGPLGYWTVSALLLSGRHFFRVRRTLVFPVAMTLWLGWAICLVMQARQEMA